ncbi:polyprenyl synthetase family protein [Marinicella sp. W31]|uniref:polyprenyl synthetase family protein n=1 Tax=Marinicella sp. W31 TaxID=3023713 RepID=UPI003757C3B7
MNLVNQVLRDHLNSEVVLINQIAEYIISNGGKRLRPMILILASKALQHAGSDHIQLAAVVELIHTATLLHDDVVDESEMRRGNKTSHEIWGNSASVLVGDFLYSKSFQMMVAVDRMSVMSILSDATNRISEGEVQQLLNVGRLDVTEAEYYAVINNKTAKLFEAGCHLAAAINDCSEDTTAALISFGKNLGIAFQIADDMLDYTADTELTGKNLGDDLAEGKLTLPLIHLLQYGSVEQKNLVEQAFENQSVDHLNNISQAIQQSGALDYTLSKAQNFAATAKEALSTLPDNIYKQALMFLCDFAWKRER